jgi:hypothetical protein
VRARQIDATGIMTQLTLHPGPRLLRVVYPDGAPLHDEDVTDRAVEFLFDRLELGPDVRLRDLFGLFERCPALLPVYRRFYAQELCAEAALGPAPDDEKSKLLYLELRQSWEYDSHTRTYAELRRFLMLGVANPPEDDENVRPEADGLLRYSMIGFPVRPMLDMPVRLDTHVRVFESDTYSYRSYQQISLVHSRDLSLGDVLQAMLWEMTWFDPPDDTEEVIEEMAELSKTPEAWSEGMTVDEFTEHFHGDEYRHGCQVLFESIGPFSAVAIDSELRRIPDSLNARQWLNKTLGKQVKLRSAYRRLSGRELRQAFREARHQAQPVSP